MRQRIRTDEQVVKTRASRVRRALWWLAKAALLVAVVAASVSQMQLDDALALRPDHASPAALSLPDGSPLRLGPKDRLRLAPDSAPTAGRYQATTASGVVVEVPADLVDGPSAALCVVPGLRSVARRLDALSVLLAFLLMGPSVLLIGVRWFILLRGCQVSIPFWSCMRLHALGLFFNTFLPGGAGGDIVKSVAVAGRTDRKAEAIGTILLDRVLGLYVLIVVACVAALASPSALPTASAEVAGLFALLTLGGVLYCSRTFRRVVRLERLLDRLPFAVSLRRADQALFDLRERRGALAAAVAVNLVALACSMSAVRLAGRALGIEGATMTDYLILVPLAYLANALPLTLGGIGLMEGAFMQLLSAASLASPTQGFSLGLLVRALQVGWSLVAGLLTLTGRRASLPKVAEQGPGA